MAVHTLSLGYALEIGLFTAKIPGTLLLYLVCNILWGIPAFRKM